MGTANLPPELNPVVRSLADEFDVLSLLGQGATSAALHARRKHDGAETVLKVFLRPLGEGADPRARFDRECKALSQLHHPGVVELLHWGMAGDVPYLAMAYRAGETLEACLQRRSGLPAAYAVEVALGLAEALAYVHGRRVVHRDVKPANVLLQADGSPLLLDFGLVRSGLQQTFQTATGLPVGTPAYMAPELFTGATAGPAADLYSLGVVLVEMLTGTCPFQGSVVQIVAAKSAPRPLRLPAMDAPTAVTNLIRDLTTAKPSDRPHDAAAVADRLRACCDGSDATGVTVESSPAVLRPTKPATAPGAVTRRNSSRRWLALLAVSVVLLVGGFLALTSSSPPPPLTTPLDELGRWADRTDALAAYAPVPQCDAETKGRLYRAGALANQKLWSETVTTLLPIVVRRRVGLVGNPLLVLTRLLEAGRLAGGDGARTVDIVAATALHDVQRCAPGHAEAARVAVDSYYAGRPPEARFLGDAWAMAHGEVEGDGLTELRRVLFGIRTHLPAAATVADEGSHFITADDGPLLTSWTVVLAGSPDFVEAAGWSMFTRHLLERSFLELRRPIASFVPSETPRTDVFTRTAARAPLGTAARTFATGFLQPMLLTPDVASVIVDDLRRSWLTAWARSKPSEGDLADFAARCRDGDIVRLNEPFVLLAPEALSRATAAVAWLAMGSTDEAFERLAPLLGPDRLFAVAEAARPLLDAAVRLAADDGRRPAVTAALTATLAALPFPEQRGLVTAALLACHPLLAKPPSSPVTDDRSLAALGASLRRYPLPASLPAGCTDLDLGRLALLGGSLGTVTAERCATVLSALAESWQGSGVLDESAKWLLRQATRGQHHRETVAAFWGGEHARKLISTDDEGLLALSCPALVFATIDDGAIAERVARWRRGLPPERLDLVDDDVVTCFFAGSITDRRLPWRADAPELATSLMGVLHGWQKTGPPATAVEALNRCRLAVAVLDTADDMDRDGSTFLRQNAVTGYGNFRDVAKAVVPVFGELTSAQATPTWLRKLTSIWLAWALIHARRLDAARQTLLSQQPDDIPLGQRWQWFVVRARLAYESAEPISVKNDYLKKAEAMPLLDKEQMTILYVKGAMR